MTIDEINEHYKPNQEKRNLKHILGSLISSYIMYEVHKQNLYTYGRRNYVDYQIYCNSANALLLEVRNLFNFQERGTEAWLIKQMGSLSLSDFEEYNGKYPLSTTSESDELYASYIERVLAEIRDVKRQFDIKEGEIYGLYEQIKLYETLEFHVDRTPEKHEDITGGFLNGFVKNKSFDVLDHLDEIMSGLDHLIDLQEKYEDCLNGGFPYEMVALKRSGLRGLVGDIHKRLGRADTDKAPILRLVKVNLPNALHYMGWH